MSPPPEEFTSFCVAFDAALYHDRETADALARLDRCITYGLQWHDRASLQSLRDYLDDLLAAPDPNAVIEAAWNSTRPRTAFWPGSQGGGIAFVFGRVRDVARDVAIAKLDELSKK